MTTDVVVGIDAGTTNLKALVVDTDGREIADAGVPTRWTVRGTWVETTAAELVAGVLEAVEAALAAASERCSAVVRAVGVGITGMAESGILLGPDGTVQAPVLAWFDPRGAEQLRDLQPELVEAFPGTTGLPLSALCTTAKLLWLRGQGIPGGAGCCWLNIPEYVALVLGADRATEPSLASRTGLLDQATGLPWSEALMAVGADSSLLPPMRPAGTSLGQVSGAGVPAPLAGAVVIVAGHDHPVASFGAGAWGPEDLFDSCGTAESVVRVVSSPLSAEQRSVLVRKGLTVGSHVLEGRWVISGPTRGGIVLKRVLTLLGRDDAAGRDLLDGGWAPAGAPRGVVVTGAAIDDEEVVIRAATDSADPDALWAAALAHVGVSVRELVEAIDDEVGRRRAVIAAGGWTAMASVRAAKIQALPDTSFSARKQPGAYGAATLAAWAAGGREGTAVDFALGFVPGAAAQRCPGRHPDSPEGVLT